MLGPDLAARPSRIAYSARIEQVRYGLVSIALIRAARVLPHLGLGISWTENWRKSSTRNWQMITSKLRPQQYNNQVWCCLGLRNIWIFTSIVVTMCSKEDDLCSRCLPGQQTIKYMINVLTENSSEYTHETYTLLKTTLSYHQNSPRLIWMTTLLEFCLLLDQRSSWGSDTKTRVDTGWSGVERSGVAL